MLNRKYQLALDMALSVNKELSERILKFLDEIPESMSEEISFYKEKGKCIKENKRWEFVNKNGTLGISVGNSKNPSKYYMNLSLNSIIKYDLPELLSENSTISIGYVTFYLYDKSKKNSKPLQLCYEFTLKKFDNKYIVNLSTRTNTFFKDIQKIIEQNGFSHMVKEIFNRDRLVYKIEGIEESPKIKIDY